SIIAVTAKRPLVVSLISYLINIGLLKRLIPDSCAQVYQIPN
ncbi:MAG: hypothetical protein RL061_1275, partial [Pseudomonadota bacterium]